MTDALAAHARLGPPQRHPSLYQLNTRVRLTALSRSLDRRATLDDIPDSELDALADEGFDWVWLLSVWQTGAAAQRISRSRVEWRREFADTLPDLREDDIVGSGFAVTRYTVHSDLGGDEALARLRVRLRARGMRLMLDFVPNHVAPDHAWATERPDFFVHASEAEAARSPQNFCRHETIDGPMLLAYGRDPYFDGWPDTLQLNYGNPALREAMTVELERIAGQCDGVRCDMAMLVLPEVFERTWRIASVPFWPAAIERVRRRSPDFVFLAEVYWDMEWALQQQGFDFTYDKRLYDRLREQHAASVRGHFRAEMDFQRRLARFLENHDEPRAAATFGGNAHFAAAVLTYCSPGLRFFHDGQLEGRRQRISPHLVRAPSEPVEPEIARFYGLLLGVLRRRALRDGSWSLLDCLPAWHDNRTVENFIAFRWDGSARDCLCIVVNYSPVQSQCFVRRPVPEPATGIAHFHDLLGPHDYDRPLDDLSNRGLFMDVGPWQYHVFEVQWPR